MNKPLALMASLVLCGFAQAAQQASDEEMIRQGRELVQKSSARVEQVSNQPAIVPSLNVETDSPLLQRHPYLQDSQKDFMDLATGKKKLSQVEAKKYDLLIFVSFSLPEESLRQYSKQAVEYGAVLVLRGMRNNSLEQTELQALGVNKAGAEWDIAPATFKKFKIERVPAIVLADASTESVLENGCAKEVDYLRVDGDVSIHHALVLMRQYGAGKLVKGAETFLDIENR
jgi:conjugal transfer pilus assembly protein TrbC